MPWIDLYKWEPGYEPDWVLEARKEKILCDSMRKKAMRKRAEADAISIAAGIIEGGGKLDCAALNRIVVETGLGPFVLRRVLQSANFEFERVLRSYPAVWPNFVRRIVAEFIHGRIKKAVWDDEWLRVEDCVIALMRHEPELEDYLSARGVRMALEAEGYQTVRRADGRGIVGYTLAL